MHTTELNDRNHDVPGAARKDGPDRRNQRRFRHDPAGIGPEGPRRRHAGLAGDGERWR